MDVNNSFLFQVVAHFLSIFWRRQITILYPFSSLNLNMSEPENSKTETSSSKEESTTSKDNVALESSTTTDFTRESEKEQSSKSVDDDSVPAESGKIQNEPNAPLIENAEKVDKSEEKVNPFPRENTVDSNTSTLCISNYSIMITFL